MTSDNRPIYQPTAQREGETAMSLEANKDLVRRFLAEVFGTGNVEAVGDFMVPNSFLYGFMRKFVAERATGIPDAQIQIQEIFGEGDKVAVSSSLSGTNSGPLLGHPPTHKEVALNSLWIFTVRDGRVISMQFASDMAQQLWVPGPT
jgi:predicted ester cyclase